MFSFLSFLSFKKKPVKGSGFYGLSADDLSKLGNVDLQYNYLTLAGQRWRNATRFSPWLFRASQAFLLIAFLALASVAVAFALRPAPLLFVSFPNGAVQCSGPLLSPKTHQPLPRTFHQQQICQALAARWTTTTSSDN